MTSDIFEELKQKAHTFSEKRNWIQYHNPKSLSMAISVEAAELLEIFQWWTIEESKDRSLDNNIKGAIESEIADIIIYILHFANVMDINIEQSILSKLKLNEARFSTEYVSDLENNNFNKKKL